MEHLPSVPARTTRNAVQTNTNNNKNQKNTTQSPKNNFVDTTFYSIHTNKVFLKAKHDFYHYKRQHLSFVEHDPQNFKCLQNIEIYLNTKFLLSLIADVESGHLARLIKSELDKGNKYPQAVWQSNLGGVHEEKAKRADGKAIFRYFTISPGSRFPFVITAYEGPGKTNPKTRIIEPDGKPEKVIRVPADREDFLAFIKAMKMNYLAFLSAESVKRMMFDVSNT